MADSVTYIWQPYPGLNGHWNKMGSSTIYKLTAWHSITTPEGTQKQLFFFEEVNNPEYKSCFWGTLQEFYEIYTVVQ
jgi:hypothetical protein